MSQLPCFSRVYPVIYVYGFHVPLADFIMFILGISLFYFRHVLRVRKGFNLVSVFLSNFVNWYS